MQDRVAAYILTVGLINACLGVVTAAGAWLLGMDAPIMWGGLAMVLPFVALSPVVVRLVQRKFDPFEPIQIVAITFFVHALASSSSSAPGVEAIGGPLGVGS